MSASGFNEKRDNILVFSNTKKHTTGVISGIGTGYTSGAPESTLYFCGVRLAESISFRVVFCRSLFVLVLIFTCIVIALPVLLRFTTDI